jgi:replicative DNA helicase
MSLEAEQSVLGSLLQWNEQLDLINLLPEAFEGLDHRIIYEAILEVKSQDLPFDPITISEHLEKTSKLEFCGGLGYLVDLTQIAFTKKHVPDYAKIISRDFKSKELEYIGREVSELAKGHGDFEAKLESALGLFDTLNVEGEKDLRDIKTHVSDYALELERRLNLDGLDGTATHFKALDEKLGGLRNGELYIIAGRPGSGKSTFALNMAQNIAKDKEKVLFFSLEMPSQMLIEKCVASLSGVNLNWFKEGGKSDDSKWGIVSECMKSVSESGLIMDDNGYQTVQSITVKAKKMGGADIIFCDYLQLMTGKGNNRTEEIGGISRELKALAKNLDCPVVALSQLNRGVESRTDRRPMMSDLRDSGEVEQNATAIMMLYRDEYYYPDYEFNKNVAEINIVKYRYGVTGNSYLSTELQCSKFMDLKPNTNYQKYEKPTQSRGGFGQ